MINNNSSSSSGSGSCSNNNLMPLRPAIKAHSAPNSPMTEQDRSKFLGRRVNFPADDVLVTGYLDPPNPWEKALNSSADEVTAAYKTACEKHQIKPLNNVLQQLKRVNSGEREEVLSLRGERLDPRHYEAIEEIFKRIQFSTVDVESTNLDDEASVALFDMIEYYESAQHLNISYNRSMTARGWQACARMLKKTQCLESLNAQNTCLNEHFMSMLCRTLRCGSSLAKLHLENCNMSGRTCTVLMTALKLNTTLKELYLAENKLTPTDALQIGNLFRANNKLEIMDLRNNHIQDAGVEHIVDGLNDQALGSAGGLKNLNLMTNQLTFHSCCHLAKAVANTKTLEVLNIGNNNITNEGIFHLREPLMKNRTLVHLGLRASRITCEGSVALAEYIADNPCIQRLELHENNIKIAGLLALSLSMKVNQSLTRLDLDKDYKRESGKEIQEQHQHLLVEIMECCERNLRVYEDHQKSLQEAEMEEPKEKLSESVCRLLSLWDNPPSPSRLAIKNTTNMKDIRIKNLQMCNVKSQDSCGRFCTNLVVTSSAVTSSPSQSPPLIVLPEVDAITRSSPALSAEPKVSGPLANPSLLSPPPPHPSPPKSRFRVSRVTLDSDALPSSAGSTPMPSPVPSPGHTPMPSPGCTPMPSPSSTPSSSPVPSPVGSPISSPCRAHAHGVLAPPPSPIRYRKGSPKSAFLKQEKEHNANRTRFSTPISSQSFVLPQVPVSSLKSSLVHNSSLLSPVNTVAIGNHAPPSSPNDSVFEDDSSVKSMFLPSKTVTFQLDVTSDDEKCLYSDSRDPLYQNTGSEAPPNTPAASISSELSSLELFQSEYGSEPYLSSPDSICFEAGSTKAVSWTDSLNSDDSPSHPSGLSTPSCMSDVCSSTSDANCRSSTTDKDQTSTAESSWSINRPAKRSHEANSKNLSPNVSCPDNHQTWKEDLHQIYAIPSETSSNTSLTYTCSSSFTESDSFISNDSGLASPDSELSGHQSPLSLSSHSENGDFLCSLESINQIVPDSYTRGSLAPPPTPVDPILPCSSHYQLKSPETCESLLGSKTGDSQLEKISDSDKITSETLNLPQLLVNCNNAVLLKEDNENDVNNKILLDKAKSDDEISSALLHADVPVRSVSDSNLDKKLIAFEDSNNLSHPANSKHSTSRRSDSLLSNMTATGRFRTITLAEPSCVRLFGGGVPSSVQQFQNWGNNPPISRTNFTNDTSDTQENSVANYSAHLSNSLTDDEKMAKSISSLRSVTALKMDFSSLDNSCVSVRDLQINCADSQKQRFEKQKQDTFYDTVDQDIVQVPTLSNMHNAKPIFSKPESITSNLMKKDLSIPVQISDNSAETCVPVNSSKHDNYPHVVKFDVHDYEMSTAFREPSDESLEGDDDRKMSYNNSSVYQKSETSYSSMPKTVETSSSENRQTLRNTSVNHFDTLISVKSDGLWELCSSASKDFNNEPINLTPIKILSTENNSLVSKQMAVSKEPVYANVSVYCQHIADSVPNDEKTALPGEVLNNNSEFDMTEMKTQEICQSTETQTESSMELCSAVRNQNFDGEQNISVANVEFADNIVSTCKQLTVLPEPIYANVSAYCQQIVEPVLKDDMEKITHYTEAQVQNLHTSDVCTSEIKSSNTGTMLTKQNAIESNENSNLSNTRNDLKEQYFVQNISNDCPLPSNYEKFELSPQFESVDQKSDSNDEHLASSIQVKMFRSVTVDVLADEKEGKTDDSKSDFEDGSTTKPQTTLTKADKSNFCRRASTGSYLGKKNGTCRKRCINMIVDEYIQQQLIELYNSAKSKKSSSKKQFESTEMSVKNVEANGSSHNIASTDSFHQGNSNVSTISIACRCAEMDGTICDKLSAERNEVENINNSKIAAQTCQNDISSNREELSLNCKLDTKSKNLHAEIDIISEHTRQQLPTDEEQSKFSIHKNSPKEDKYETGMTCQVETVENNEHISVHANLDKHESVTCARKESDEHDSHRFSTSEISHHTQDTHQYNNFRINHSDSAQYLSSVVHSDSVCTLQLTMQSSTSTQHDSARIKNETNEENSQGRESTVPAINSPVLQQILVDNELLNVVNSPMVLSTNIVSNEPFVDDMCHNISSSSTSNSAANGFSLNLCILEDTDTSYSNFAGGGMPVANQDPTPPESLRT